MAVAGDAVDVQLVQFQGAFASDGVEGRGLEPEVAGLDVETTVESPVLQIEGENAVERGRGQEQCALVHLQFMAVLEIGVVPGVFRREVGPIGEQPVAGGDVDPVPMAGDSPQSPAAAVTAPVDLQAVPVDGPLDRPPLQVDEIGAAVAFSGLTPPHHGGRDQFHPAATQEFAKANIANARNRTTW